MAYLSACTSCGNHISEFQEAPDGNLYEWVEGVNGLGNPIGIWKKIKGAAKTVGKGVSQAARYAYHHPVQAAAVVFPPAVPTVYAAQKILPKIQHHFRDLPQYGNYCGPITCGRRDCGPPLDSVDQCCQQHDECHKNFVKFQLPWNRLEAIKCDYKSCACWKRTIPTNPKAAVIREAAIRLFCPPPLGINRPSGLPGWLLPFPI